MFSSLVLSSSACSGSVVPSSLSPLVNGKGMTELLHCGPTMFPTVRSLECVEIMTLHYAPGREYHSPLVSKFRKLHELQYSSALTFTSNGELEVARLTDWVFETLCAMHDFHNAAKWAAGAHVQDKGALSEFYVLDSLRNTSICLLLANLEILNSLICCACCVLFWWTGTCGSTKC